MNAINYRTENEIHELAIETLRDGIGVVGLIRFLQQFDRGHGNYVKDRQQWQKNYTVETIMEAMNRKHHQVAEGEPPTAVSPQNALHPPPHSPP